MQDELFGRSARSPARAHMCSGKVLCYSFSFFVTEEFEDGVEGFD